MRRFSAFAFIAAVLIECAPGARAAEPDALKFFEEEAKVVTASRREQSIMESPSAISVITRKDIELSAAHTIPELIQYVVGMDGFTKTRTQMAVGARGSAYDETPKTLVLIDGQPVNLVVHSGMEWPTLPVTFDEISRIEILRGPASVIYGADALTGVINIVTLAPRARVSSVAGAWGENGTVEGGVSLARALNERWAASFNGRFTQTQIKGIATTPQDTLAAPNWAIKDWAKIYTGTYRVDYRGDDLTFTASGGFSTDEEGYNPSPGDLAVDRARRRQLYLNHKITKAFDADTLTVRAGLRNYWQFNEKWTGSAYTQKYVVPESLGVDSDVQYTMMRVPDHTVILGAGLSGLEASRDIVSNAPPYRYDEKDRLLTFYAQDQVSTFDERLLWTVGGRYDKWYRFAGVFTPRAAVNALFFDRTLSLRLAAASAFRRPAFDENYYFVNLGGGGWFKGSQITNTTAAGQLVPGSALQPEKLRSYETGLRWNPDSSLYADAELYYQEIRNDIDLKSFPNPAGPPNLTLINKQGVSTNKGVELELKKQLTPKLSGFVHYTYEYSHYESPANKAAAGILYQGWGTLDLRWRYVSSAIYSEIPAMRVSAYHTVDVAVSKTFGAHYFAKVGVLNLIDQPRYEYPIYTQLTRKVILTLQYAF